MVGVLKRILVRELIGEGEYKAIPLHDLEG
jgi:hypothetical protein